jgi:hypothetical protein
MPVAFVILALFVGGFLGVLMMALACAAHDREESLGVGAGRRARRSVVDRRYIEVERARRQPLRSRAGWVGGSSSVASLGPH